MAEAARGTTDGTAHEQWCDLERHTDPAFDCASPIDDTHGLSTHISGTGATAKVYASTTAPIALTAAACLDLAARFSHLGNLLLHRH